MLSVLDGLWKDHLLAMDHLKEGIGLRGYAQQDPLVAYKKESFEMFEEMMMRFQEDTARYLFRMQIIGPDGQPIDRCSDPRHARMALRTAAAARRCRSAGFSAVGDGRRARTRSRFRRALLPRRQSMSWRRSSSGRRSANWSRRAGWSGRAAQRKWRARTGDKVGRNDPCPCGSGKNTRSATGRRSLISARTKRLRIPIRSRPENF